MFSDQLPTVFSILFLIAFIFPIVLIGKLAQKAQLKYGFSIVIGFYIPFLTIVSIASFAGFYDTIMLPPKIVVTTTLPLAIFLTILYTTKRCKKANEALRLEDLVGVHVFRFIGSFFIILLLHGLLPKFFALVAGIGDLVTAVSSIFVVRAIQRGKSYAKRLTLIWNTFGFVDILATSVMAILFTKWSIDHGTMGVEFLATFPFCFIPAFAPATIIFLHLLIFRKLFSDNIS